MACCRINFRFPAAFVLGCWALMILVAPASARQQNGAGEGSAAAAADGSGQESSPQKNSTRKLRVRPSQQSLRAGSAVKWLSDFDQAISQSQETGKPIFWYVPSVSGTFMDRKAEVNMYMLAGPFSWPATIDLLNQNFVPLKRVPGKREANQFGIEVYKFIEPGFLIIRPDQTVALSADRLTTTNPQWFYHQVAATVGVKESWSEASDPAGVLQLDRYLKWLENDAAAPVSTTVTSESIEQLRRSEHVEMQVVAAMLLHVTGKQQLAIDQWASIAKDFPEHPLGWKAACEAQRIGPFGRGFEVFGRQINLDAANTQSFTSAAPLGQFDDQQLWRHGVDFLLRMQDHSGGIFDSDYDFGGTDSLPNVYVAVTSLVGLALLEAVDLPVLSSRRNEILERIGLAIEYVSDERHLNFDDRDEILWAQAYRIRFLALAKRRGHQQATLEKLQSAVDQLQRLQLNNGTWFHEYANAFVTATALVALLDAKSSGAAIDQAKVELGLSRLENQRYANGVYPYDSRRAGRNDSGTEKDLAASGGRLSICELARFGWQKIAQEDLAEAVKMSLSYHHLLEKALKYDNHTNTYAYGGFFFWYDMQARSEAIRMLPAGLVRDHFLQQQKAIVRRLPEIDGCFVDSHELGRCYGTAMGLLSLGAP